MTNCPCGSGRAFDACCGPILAGEPAPTAEALMRSRYTAFLRHDLDHVERTHAPEIREDFNRGEAERVSQPMVWRYSQMMPTSWDDSLALVADVTRRVIEEMGEDGVIVSAFDHGGAAGGYENTWGTGKLYFDALKIKNIRIHNRPAYNSEVHASRDMGVSELNNCYEDAELADTLFVVGANPLENQTNYFLAHWVPNLRGETLDKKKRLLASEPHAAARVIVVDPPPGNTVMWRGMARLIDISLGSEIAPQLVGN